MSTITDGTTISARTEGNAGPRCSVTAAERRQAGGAALLPTRDFNDRTKISPLLISRDWRRTFTSRYHAISVVTSHKRVYRS